MRFLLCALLLALCSSLHAEMFTVEDIRLEGLQRVSAGTVFERFPVNVGDKVDSNRLVNASRRLFSSGLFNDIELLRDGNVLLIKVVELPTITKIDIEGNKAIKTDALLDGLKQSGLAEGLVFKRSTLERIALELERQYVAQGRYDARIETEVVRLPRNRVALNIKVKEGNVATIEHINIVGNSAFSDEELLKQLQLHSTNFWSWYSSDNKYSREKLAGDMETLRSYYLDRGYVRFNIESTQVSVSPGKDSVYITMNVTEGDVYSIKEIKLAGDLVMEEEQYTRLYLLKSGDTFSRRLVTLSSDLMTQLMGNDGYTFAKVDGIPTIYDEEKQVDLTFFVEPGKRTYVRRINFAGNQSTMDEVLRREMVQMEGGWASTEKIDAGKERLNQLGFFKNVNVETPGVPGTDDLIDINYSVEEQRSGSLDFKFGYAGNSGTILGASVSQNNFLGTGNRVSIGVQKNNILQSYNFSYTDPYYTVDGVSRGFNLFYRETDFKRVSTISDYQTNAKGGSMVFGYPVSLRQRVSMSVGYVNTDMFLGNSVPAEITEFVEKEGFEYDEYTLGLSWRYNNLNRGLFPTEGTEHRVSADISVPGSDLTYYKMAYVANFYVSLADEWAIRLRTEFGYGTGFGDLKRLPFFKNYRAGGLGSVRGYRANSLGPKGLPEYRPVDVVETDSNGNARYELDSLGQPKQDKGAPVNLYKTDDDGAAVRVLNVNRYKPIYKTEASGSTVTAPLFLESERALGGNILTEASLELIYPFPFIEDRRSVRTVLFFDSGNTFSNECFTPSDFDIPTLTAHPYCREGVDLAELRTSVGAGLTWVTAIAPMTFTYAIPLNDRAGDRTEGFEFTLGQVF